MKKLEKIENPLSIKNNYFESTKKSPELRNENCKFAGYKLK